MSKEFNGGEFNITENEKVYEGPHSSIDSVTLSSSRFLKEILEEISRAKKSIV